MSEPRGEAQFVSFEAAFEPCPPGTPAPPRPPGRPRESADGPFRGAQFVSFEAAMEPVPPGTPATPRPPGRPREAEPFPDPDAAFAGELADRVLEYARGRPAGLTAEQLAALIQQLVARRSA